MKKTLLVLACLLLMLCLLTACIEIDNPVNPPDDTSVVPVTPVNPDNPDVPDVPDVPDKPDTPDTPDIPDNPITPDIPDVPVNPDNPDTPDIPVNPDNPDTPDIPDVPVNPDNPDTPDIPVNPDNPDTPDIPDIPDNPDNPDMPDTPDIPDNPDTPVEHVHNFVWNKSGNDVDVATCQCGETKQFTKRFTNLQQVVYSQNQTLNLSSFLDDDVTASGFAFNGVLLQGSLDAIDFSNVTDFSKHGDHNLTFTATLDGESHQVAFCVRLITDVFTSGDEQKFSQAVRGVKNPTQSSKYGFYRLDGDLEPTQSNGFPALYWGDLPEGHNYGFAGTIYSDNGATIKAKSNGYGLLGSLYGATIKNVTFVDTYFRGSDKDKNMFLASSATNVTLQDVNFVVTGNSYGNATAIFDNQNSAGGGCGWLVGYKTSGCHFVNVNFYSETSAIYVGRIFGDDNASNVYQGCNLFDVSATYVEGKKASVVGLSAPKNVIVVGDQVRLSIALDFDNLLTESTQTEWHSVLARCYKPSTCDNVILLGNVPNYTPSSLVTSTRNLGGASYAIKADGNKFYLVGADEFGVSHAIYKFLNVYAGFEPYNNQRYALNTQKLQGALDPSLLDTSYQNGVFMPFVNNGYRNVITDEVDFSRMGFSGDFTGAKVMTVLEGDTSSMTHNAFCWLPYSTFGSIHNKWYTNAISQSKKDLCYTAHGDSAERQAMIQECVKVVKKAVAFTENATKTFLPFAKKDMTDACSCSACQAIAKEYGSLSATVILFMNDLMSAIKADETIARKDFDLLFYAYTDFELAPTKKAIALDDRVTALVCTSFSFNLQRSINHQSNQAGKANLQKWAEISRSGDLFLWTYSTNYQNYMMPVDTFEFFDENAYEFFRQCKVTMFYSQSQVQQRGQTTAWHNLKAYLDGALMRNADKTQQQCIADYMQKTFGNASTAMTKFFNSVRQYTGLATNSTFDNHYKNNKYGAYTLLYAADLEKTQFWSLSKLNEWLGCCTEAYDALQPLKTTNPEEYERLKKNVDAEWVSPAYLKVVLYGDDNLKTQLKATITQLGITHYTEFEGDVLSHLD